jgi:glycosyltransferase involved in cell wall biosynthesis
MTIAVISMIRDPWGGSEELWYQMAQKALAEKHRVIHLSYEHPVRHKKITALIEKGLLEYTRPGWIPPTAGAFKRLLYLGLNFLRKKIKNPLHSISKHKPEVIIYNGTAYSICKEKALLAYLKKKKEVRLFIIAHYNNDSVRDISDWQSSLVKTAYARAEKVLFVSARNRLTAERQLACKIPNASIIRNPVNLPETGIIAYPATEGTIQMAMIGNLVTIHKGQDLLFEVLGSEVWLQRKWQLNIYGVGKDKDYLTALARMLNIQDRIFFHGKTDNIREVWQKNEILVMPSLMEGMPLVVVEAMLCGRTCVATDVGGISEWIEDNRSGFIAAAPSVNCIGEAMNRAWERRTDWEKMGTLAFSKALALYDKDAGGTLLNLITHN